MSLAANASRTGLALGVERIEVLLEAVVGRDARIDRASPGGRRGGGPFARLLPYIIPLGRRGLGRRTRKWVCDTEFWVLETGLQPHAEQALLGRCSFQLDRERLRLQSGATGALSPSADHWSLQSIGRSIKRLPPKPRGSRPSIAALTRAGERKASEMFRGSNVRFCLRAASIAKRVDSVPPGRDRLVGHVDPALR